MDDIRGTMKARPVTTDAEIDVDDFRGTVEDVLETSMQRAAMEISDITSTPLETPLRNRDDSSPVFEFDSPEEVGVIAGGPKPFQKSAFRNRGHATRNGGVPEFRGRTPARPCALAPLGDNARTASPF